MTLLLQDGPFSSFPGRCRALMQSQTAVKESSDDIGLLLEAMKNHQEKGRFYNYILFTIQLFWHV
jgi:hypothetical protein